jgi:predicted TPR repeat methyltransferase
MEPSPTTADQPEERIEREISFDEALAYCIRFQQSGELEKAADLYRRLLEVVPDHARLLHYAGVLAHQQGRHDESIRMIERSLALDPDQADGYNNLGIVYKAAGRLDEAVAAYERAVALDSRHANAYNNLGVVFRAQGKMAEAEAAYRQAVDIDPSHVDAYHNLGILMGRLGRTREAVLCHYRVITLFPEHPEARRMLAMAHSALGEVDKAIAIYRDWLEKEPDHPIVQHLLAACTGEDVPERASDGCIETMFDRFSQHFEETLSELKYQAPRIVAAMLEDSGRAPSKSLDVLDVGCGTGLCGPLIAPWAKRLTGVDLSPGMLERAKAKNVYDDLVKAELTTYLESQSSAFDLIVSADTLCYFGSLDAVVSAATLALRPGGVFICTLERLADAVGLDFRIETHGRYSHGRHYVERLLREAGLQADIVSAELRMEAGLPVAGLAIRAAKPNGSSHA